MTQREVATAISMLRTTAEGMLRPPQSLNANGVPHVLHRSEDIEKWALGLQYLGKKLLELVDDTQEIAPPLHEGHVAKLHVLATPPWDPPGDELPTDEGDDAA